MLTTRMNPRVFWGASAIAGGLLLLALMAPATSDLLFGRAQAWVIDTFGWFYVASVAGFLLFVTVLAVGPTGRLKLGPDDAEPDFPYVSWLAMLFAAGMGIGLMYFAVAEPVQHYIAPPEAEPGTFLAAREAMVITYTHWGVHAWAIYAVVGLSLAYFAHRKGLPLTMRSSLYPLLRQAGERLAGRRRRHLRHLRHPVRHRHLSGAGRGPDELRPELCVRPAQQRRHAGRPDRRRHGRRHPVGAVGRG